MRFFNNFFFLRLAIAVILLMHGVPSIVSGDVNIFGNEHLRAQGFGSMGLPLAWAIKLSHIAAAVCLLLNRFIKPAAIVTIIILVTGIFMVHLKDGWYVVGGGNNGVEFNFLLIFALLTLLFPGRQTTA
ncbi:MAG: DoxX family protein [Ferruginibacter sp.]